MMFCGNKKMNTTAVSLLSGTNDLVKFCWFFYLSKKKHLSLFKIKLEPNKLLWSPPAPTPHDFQACKSNFLPELGE